MCFFSVYCKVFFVFSFDIFVPLHCKIPVLTTHKILMFLLHGGKMEKRMKIPKVIEKQNSE